MHVTVTYFQKFKNSKIILIYCITNYIRYVAMLGFLALPSHLRHWAYGVRQLVDSKGQIILMPNCTRREDRKDLYSKYKNHCISSGESCVPRDDFEYATEVIAGRDETMLDALKYI